MNATTTTATTGLTLRQASEMCRCSVGRIRYHRDELVEEGATITDAGYAIPVSALYACGLLRGEAAPVALTREQEMEAECERLRREVETLRAELETRQRKTPGLFGLRRR